MNNIKTGKLYKCDRLVPFWDFDGDIYLGDICSNSIFLIVDILFATTNIPDFKIITSHGTVGWITVNKTNIKEITNGNR